MKNVAVGDLAIGNDRPLAVIAGPCQLETLDHAQMIAGRMKEACAAAGAQYVFKASFDKANRTSLSGIRGPGMDEGLKILQAVGKEIGVQILARMAADQGPEMDAATEALIAAWRTAQD